VNNQPEVRTRHLGTAALWLFLACIGPGVWYWVATGAHFGKCVYGDPVCSLTVSTYLLCTLTLGAFLAAYRAARYAHQAIQIERQVVIAIEECSSIANVAPGPQGEQNRHNAHRTEERYMKSITGGFRRIRPDNYSREQYGMVEFDCMSVGRSPVVNGELCVTCKAKDGTEDRKVITIGSIPTDEFVHLRIWIDRDLSDVEFRWIPHRVKHKGGLDVEFHARSETFAVPVVTPAPPEGPQRPHEPPPAVVL
jgi:hypothetical protein